VIGLGTLLNIGAILAGSAIGVLIGSRLPEKTNRVVTDILGLVTIVLGGLNLASLGDKSFIAAVGSGGTLLVVLGSLLIGGIIGSLLKIEERLEGLGSWLQSRFTPRKRGALISTVGSEITDPAITVASIARERFITGFVDASLIFCIGPLAILGAFSDGTGQGIDQLALKSTLDGFASIAFAASLGWGVAASALPVGIWQGALTVAAFALGSVLPAAAIASLTATGGVLLLGVGLRLLNIRAISVGDMLPALVFAPLFTWLVSTFFG
jgi:uncharacterized membrane protein YqgA involved in biofilm formation